MFYCVLIWIWRLYSSENFAWVALSYCSSFIKPIQPFMVIFKTSFDNKNKWNNIKKRNGPGGWHEKLRLDETRTLPTVLRNVVRTTHLSQTYYKMYACIWQSLTILFLLVLNELYKKSCALVFHICSLERQTEFKSGCFFT